MYAGGKDGRKNEMARFVSQKYPIPIELTSTGALSADTVANHVHNVAGEASTLSTEEQVRHIPRFDS